MHSASRRKENREESRWEVRMGRFSGGGGGLMLMGAWHQRGGRGLQERHVHRKFLCGSLSVGWQHFNAGLISIMDTGERTRRENTLGTQSRTQWATTCTWMNLCVEGSAHRLALPILWLFFFFSFLLCFWKANLMFHFPSACCGPSSAQFHQQPYRT